MSVSSGSRQVPSGGDTAWEHDPDAPPGKRVEGIRRFREITPGLGLPIEFVYSTLARDDTPALALGVQFQEGQWTPTKLTLEAPSGGALTTNNIRIPLARVLRDALLEAARLLTYEPCDETGRAHGSDLAVRVYGRIKPDGTREVRDCDAWVSATPIGGTLAETWETLTADELATAAWQAATQPKRLTPPAPADLKSVGDQASRHRRTRIPMSDTDLAAIAERYRTIVTTGQRNPTEIIAVENNASRMTASRWLRRARDLGLLEEAREPREK